MSWLKRLAVTSVDLCRRGANPRAEVRLAKTENGRDRRLAKLEKLDSALYRDVKAILDENAELKRVAPFMKEYGTSRGSEGDTLEARVRELMRGEEKLSRAEATVRAYEERMRDEH